MSFGPTGKALKSVAAIASISALALVLPGCTTLSSSAFGDPVTTGATGRMTSANLNQPMPSSLGSSQRVAAGPYIPPADVGGGQVYTTGAAGPVVTSPVLGSGVVSQDLPDLVPVKKKDPEMSAQPVVAPAPAPRSAAFPPSSSPAPELKVVPAGAYTHVIESGESLYTIARRYNVTAQAIVQANGLGSPDRIYVGQRLMIPGRPDLSPAPAPIRTADIAPATKSVPATKSAPVAIETPAHAPAVKENTAMVKDPELLKTPEIKAPAKPASLETPKVSGAEKFRWPVSGRVITDFATSKGTGINIEVPEGAAVRAAENGTIIYVGNGVEGYGNLILIRHANGYVSAYAHLQSMSVTKGDTVSRGDAIGKAGMSGSVNKPQLHFELRKGATPVDPVPLLAG
jgi:murein DD-endopeptidase MepM/ murein hydrolase activator NlpD